MTDREMLVMAAKAAGWEITGEGEEGFSVDCGHTMVHGWNPLYDSEWAFELMVRLNMDVLRDDNDVEATCNTGAEFEPFGIQPIGNHACSATRRAIVIAAAELGRTMQ